MELYDKYCLVIRWKRVEYIVDGVANLIECYLSGPVVKELSKLNINDYILLDFSNQYAVFIPSYYIAKFSWNGVEYFDNIVKLKNVILENKYLNSVPKLHDDDFIVVDTSKHVEELHHLYLTYPAKLFRYDGHVYGFGG